ncbi:MAG: DoxX family protein [Pseudomonadota bacterium]
MNTLTDTLPSGASTTIASNGSQDIAALIGRLLIASLFILAGINKLGAAEGTIGYIASVGLPLAEPIYYATLAIEIIGGVMLAVGFKARYAAAALGLFSIAAAVFFHADFTDQSQMTSFLKNLSLAGGMFFVAAFGPGRFSLDRR